MTNIRLNAYSWKIINILTFAIVSLITKSFIHAFSVFEIFFALQFIAMLITFIVYKKTYQTNPKIYTDKLSILRALVNVCALILWFVAIKNLEISDATILSYTTPIFGVIIGVLVFKDKLKSNFAAIIILGLIGCYSIIKPSFNIAALGFVASLSSALLWAVHDSIIKKQTINNRPVLESIFQSTFMTSLITLPFAIKYWSLSFSFSTLLLIFCGIISFANLYSLGQALKQANLSYLMPISFLRVLFTTLGGYLFYNETIGINEIVGYCFIILSNYVLIKSK